MRRSIAAFALVVALVAPSIALAGDHTCAHAYASGRVCELVFDRGDDVRGERPIPLGGLLSSRLMPTFESLIELRLDFRHEVLSSVDHL